MEFIIHYNGNYEDQIVIEEETIEEVREKAIHECNIRGWKPEDCWSEKIED